MKSIFKYCSSFSRSLCSNFKKNRELKKLYTLEDVEKVRREKEEMSLRIASFKGCWIDLQDLKNKLISLKARETMILRKISKQEEYVLNGVVIRGNTFEPLVHNFDLGVREFWNMFKSIRESEVWVTFKKEIEEGKYDSFFKNNRSYFSHLRKLIILFNIDLKNPCSKRILEVLVAHIFFYINKRKVEGHNVKISPLFDMTSFFSSNYRKSILYKDNFKELNKYKRLSDKNKRFNFQFSGVRLFEKIIESYSVKFLQIIQGKGGEDEFYSIFFLWFIFINLGLFREYLFSNRKNLILLKDTSFMNRVIIFNLFLVFFSNIKYFSFLFYSRGALNCNRSDLKFEFDILKLEVVEEFHSELYECLVTNKKFSPVNIKVPVFKKVVIEGEVKTLKYYVRIKTSYKDFIGAREFVFLGEKKDFYVKCFADLRLGIFFKSGNTGKESININSEYLFKDSFFYRYRNFYRGDLVYLFFSYLFFDSTYNHTRFGTNFFYPGDKFLKKIKPFTKDLFPNKRGKGKE